MRRSREGYISEETIKAVKPEETYFWGTYDGAEIDLVMIKDGRMPGEENEIIERVLAGDRDAYAELIEACKGPLYNLACRMTGSTGDAEDLTQETFIRAYLNIKRFDPQRSFFTWIYTICLNLIRKHLKRSGRDVPQDYFMGEKSSYAGSEPDGNPESAFIREQEARRLDHHLQGLKMAMREVIVLRYIQGLSVEETAAVTGLSMSAVKMRVYRGLRQLERELGLEED
jgi:RNA polymerase sigma-70 factor (ECF subfamily)